MSTTTPLPLQPVIDYPDSDGQPMAENTLQFRWIVTIQGGLDALFRDDPNVFVAGDLLWYPVEGDNTIRVAPDIMVVFGRPKGYRGSYRQWEEGGIAPQVGFEILSPGNRFGEMMRKFHFYERYGLEEFYTFDPDKNELAGYLRVGAHLREIPSLQGWFSPRLGVQFEVTDSGLQIVGPDGRKFVTYVELATERDQLAAERDRERQRVERLAAQLRALGVDPEV